LIDAYGEETIVWATYMLYGDPTFEFAFTEKETPAQPVRSEPAQVEWQQVMRGEERPEFLSAPKSKRSPLLYAALGVLLVAVAYGGYTFYSVPENQNRNVASVPAAAQLPVAAPEADDKIEVPEKAELKSAPPVAEIKKSVEIAKAKEPISTAKEKEKAPAPAGKSQESTPSVPTKEQVAVVKEPTPPVVAGPLTLKMNIIGQRKEAEGQYTEILVNEGSVLRSLDNFQVHMETNRPAYVYILVYDSQGRAGQIFPDPKIDRPGFVEGGRKLVVPAKDLWFWLDESSGTETIYVLATEKPMADIHGLLAKMERTDDSGKQQVSKEIKERIAVIQRGVGGITKGQAVTYTLSDGKKIQKVTEVVTGTGSVVRAVSFLHR